MMTQHIGDIQLNLSEEYTRKIAAAFDLEDMRRGIYEVVSLYILKNNLYTDVFKTNKALAKSLDKHLYIDKNTLHFDVNRLVEENVPADKLSARNELGNKILELARASLTEFLIYITKQTAKTKNAMAEAEGLLDRFTIVGTDIVRFYVHDNEYQVNFKPYKAGTVSPVTIRSNPLATAKLKLNILKTKLDTVISGLQKDSIKNYFKEKILKVTNTLLAKTADLFAKIPGADAELLTPGGIGDLEADISRLETDTGKMEDLLNDLTQKDLDTISMLAIDLADPEEVLKMLDNTEAGKNLSPIIKANISKLKKKNSEQEKAGRQFFSILKDKLEQGELVFSNNNAVTEEHILSEVEGSVNFKHAQAVKAKKAEIENPDVRINMQARARKSAKRNFFTNWLTGWQENKHRHINFKLDDNNTGFISGKDKKQQNTRRTNAVI